MRRPAYIVSLALVALLASGCAPSPAPVDTPAASASASPTPSPTLTAVDPEPVPEGDSADPSTWIVSDTGMGPLELGMPFTQAIAVLPGAEDACMHAYIGAGGDAWIMRQPDQADGTLVVAMWYQSAGPKTVEGIGIGSPESDVLAAYPDAATVERNSTYLQSGRVFFGIRDGVVSEIGVTTSDPPYEFCG